MAQEYWRVMGLRAEVVILNEHQADYLDEMQHMLTELLQQPPWVGWLNKSGGIFLLRADGMADPERRLLAAVARVVLTDDLGDLVQQLERPAPWLFSEADVPPAAELRRPAPAPKPVSIPRLVMEHGLGGFTADGREHVVVLEGDRETPLPWSNVLANPDFGTIVTSSGAAFTWAGNSRENRLTPFANDPLSDPTGEAIYLRDEDSGEVWGATPGPLPRRAGGGRWVVRHGAGVTRFQHAIAGLAQELVVSIAPDDPVKLAVLTLRNDSDRPRRLSVFDYVEWVMGPPRAGEQRFVVTEYDDATGTLLARNTYNSEFRQAVSFLRATMPAASYTGDRAEFVGRNRTLAAPAALLRERLAGRTGAGLDPCGALQIAVALAPGETRSVAFVLGQGRDRAHAVELASRYAPLSQVESAVEATERSWDEHARRHTGAHARRLVRSDRESLAAVPVARAAASGRAAGHISRAGPSGFAINCRTCSRCCSCRPDLCRAHLLRAASRQFVEGDVQHWWHPPSGRGTRTRCSDDLLWLPYAVPRYVTETGDDAVLDEVVPFLEQPPLEPGQHETYMQPRVSAETASLFEHCLRAIDHVDEIRRARPAAHRHRRLERRDESRRARGTRRERVARMVSGDGAERLRAAVRPAGPRRAGAALPHRSALAERHAGARLGWRLVPPRLFRRRNAAGIGAERGVQARFAHAVVGGALGRGACRAACGARHARRARAPGPA